jgi:ABC-type lipoprotein export system ATPase subunit/ABC-type antimicrobial peptide transport system permease subunit
MLQLNSITKAYKVADFEQIALDGVSLAFRGNEFAAILGPSGSGKTTLLNIVGGLDHSDSGELIIDGVSTREYKDRDWDTYRNNRVGFVFQSYNLIPHQTILSNVELALTLSGVSKAERREKARAALAQVGLEDHMRKRPNQLSGGQMQRVAIARALVNDPEILLADEPTGALDKRTGEQIMQLLTQIAADRLVIMVTHNPELAERYANRIINLSDGQVVSDTNPYLAGMPSAEPDFIPEEAAPKGKRVAMSFFTAISLSFNNLMTKKGRTLMTAFAGSIGIIGIALILALANGVNEYIKNVEEDTMSQYPLTIERTSVDFTSMLVGMGATAGENNSSGADNDKTGKIKEVKIVSDMLENVSANDLASLKTFLDDEKDSRLKPYVNSIEYSYDVTPQIYLTDTSDGVVQANPDIMNRIMGTDSGGGFSSMLTMGVSTNLFSQLPSRNMITDSHEVVSGHWPENDGELLLVLGPNGILSDYLLYVIGLRDPAELQGALEEFEKQNDVTLVEEEMEFTYDDMLGLDFRLVPSYNYYTWDNSFKVWKDRRADEKYMKKQIADGKELKIVGIAKPKDPNKTGLMQPGVYYTPELTNALMENAAESEIVEEQLAKPDVDVFSGTPFSELNDKSGQENFNMAEILDIDENAIRSAFNIDASKLASIDFGDALNPEALTAAMPEMPEIDPSEVFKNIKTSDIPTDDLTNFAAYALTEYMDSHSDALQKNTENIMQGFGTWVAEPAQLQKIAAGTGMTELLTEYLSTQVGAAALGQSGAGISDDFSKWLEEPSAQKKLTDYFNKNVNLAPLSKKLTQATNDYMNKVMDDYTKAFAPALENQISQAMRKAMEDLAANMPNAVSIDQGAFRNAFKLKVTQDELTQILIAMMADRTQDFDSNMKLLGYASPENPAGIKIYPKDFSSKQKVIDILDSYNARMEKAGEDDKVIAYTDMVGLLMRSVTDIVDKITAVLVAFVAISLVVSSIMIGIITYISVLERRKEIGILRSIGARKRDIANVFNAETLIVGFIAGLMGVLLSVGITIPANIIVEKYYDVPNIAILPAFTGVILIVISCALSLIAGLIPASAASRRDPVEALRSE